MSTLTFTTPTGTWLERLPLGNGRIGAMVGVAPAETRIGLNEASAWSGSPASARRDAVDPAAAASALAAARAKLDRSDPIGAEAELRVLQHRYAQAFLPVGEIVLAAGDAGADAGAGAVRRSLDLRDGVHTATAAGLAAVTACPSEPDLLVHAVRSARPVDISVRFATPLRVRDERAPMAERREWVLDLPADVAPAHEPGDAAISWDLPGIHPGGIVVAWLLRHDGSAEADGEAVMVRGATRLEVLVAIESTVSGLGEEPGGTARARRRAAALLADAADAEGLVAEHRARHRAASGFRFELGRPAPSLRGREAVDPLGAGADVAAMPTEALLGIVVEYGHHLLRASSRAGGAPANLQGIWNAELQPPWSSAFTLNINTPMNYWGAEASGGSAAHLALLELLEALARHGTDTAARLYGARGWVAHHNTDIWGYSLPTRGDASWSQWPLGGAWLVRQFDEHRRHGAMSPRTLERYRPIVAGCARFLLDVLVADGDGALATSPSTSPEHRFLTAHGPASLTRSSALDRALVGDVLEIAATVLGASDPGLADEARAASDPGLADEARAARGRIPGPRIARDGTIAEWQGEPDEEDPRHRHLSHLFPWFPGDRVGDADEQAAVRASLDRRGDDSTGWSLAWKIALRARLRDAAGVERLLALALRPVASGPRAGAASEHRGGLYPNLFAAHPPFQIDGNLGLVGAVLECLVQSHRPGRIDLLSAVPAVLETGRLRGAVARPGVLLDLDWAGGRLERVRLRARSAAQAGRYRVSTGEHGVDVDVDADADTVLTGAGLTVAPPAAGPDPDFPTPDRSTT
ncbi:glycosyl hydrolase family 95 catalytic domain-containing protein [Microbacterium oleivorans]|uniref:Glycoside hydrolase N-terminal domain-containing protein n=1 Tax=Microbacterium oleivorans TaxID=273677 RepID=A0A7D5JXT5_9MICO|nr:glycoside hydrolase N-terminal domain-containing protein [Microbacterium oleivorans]QLD11283.1 glycoside hydrolase N-terminal domain-containing protein [Microbacterium oleivorans]